MENTRSSTVGPNDLEKGTTRPCLDCRGLAATERQLDAIVLGGSKDFEKRVPPPGVTNITILDQYTVRISYNAKHIGARDLRETEFDIPLRLAPVQAQHDLESGNREIRKTTVITALSIVLTIPVLLLAWAPLPKDEILYGSISLGLATVVQVVVAGPFFRRAFAKIPFSKQIDVDLLVVLSTTAAYLFSLISFTYLVKSRPLPTGQFFQTSTLLVTIVMVGRLISDFAHRKAVESISIRPLQTPTALLVEADGSTSRVIDARLLQYGGVFKVAPDSCIPTHGTVISGVTEVDESMVTGEARLVEKKPGSPVIAGCINFSGMILVELLRLPTENTISQIANMVDQAKDSKPRSQLIADRVVKFFVPAVAGNHARITVRKQDSETAVVNAVTYAISALIISCPCAIGLAVPMVVIIAAGVAAKHGVIFKSAESIENAWKIDHAVLTRLAP